MNSTFRRLRKFSLLFLIFVLGAAFPTAWPDRFKQANDLYRQGRYREAAPAYEALVSEGAISVALFYNLGNSYFKQGQIGKAVLAYERALRLSPHDKEILGNLAYAMEFVQDKVAGPEPSPWARRFVYLYEQITPNLLLASATSLYFLLILVLCFMILRPSARAVMRKWFIVLCVFLAIVLSCFGLKMFSERYSQAIIIAREVEVRYGPSPQETKAFLLHEGTKCAVREFSGEWALIWLPNDQGGWVPRESLEQI